MFKIHLVSWRSNTKQRHVGTVLCKQDEREMASWIFILYQLIYKKQNVLIGAAQEVIETQVRGRLANIHRAMHICPHAAVNGSNSENSPFPRWTTPLGLQIIKQILTFSFSLKQNTRLWKPVKSSRTAIHMSGRIRVVHVLKHIESAKLTRHSVYSHQGIKSR